MKKLKKVSNCLPLFLKVWLVTFLRRKKVKLTQGRRVFVFLSADYGNIGDIAISAAQREYLKNTLSDYAVVRIPISQTRLVIKSIRKQVKSHDIVTIIGGGNMGSMYPDIEELRQLIIRTFTENRIICFPQSLDWSNSKKSNRALQSIVEIYAEHADIHIFARESVSHAKLKELFSRHPSVNVGLVPDIVLSTTAETLGIKDCTKPSGILRCLREDKEAALTAKQRAILDKALAQVGFKIDNTDTHAGGSQLSDIQCAALLADKVSQFRSAKLVITDRLHGMILCLLSGTPCLVLANSNHKIRQTWLDWLNEHPRLIFVDPEQFDEIPNFISVLLSEPRGVLRESPINISQYDNLREALTRL